MVDYPTVQEIKRRFRAEGFLIYVKGSHDGYEVPSVSMHPLNPGRLAGPVGFGTTPEQAAWHTWEIFDDNRAAYIGRRSAPSGGGLLASR